MTRGRLDDGGKVTPFYVKQVILNQSSPMFVKVLNYNIIINYLLTIGITETKQHMKLGLINSNLINYIYICS